MNQRTARPTYRLDVITLGRSSVDLYGQQIGGRLEDMRTFAKYVGGCPTNIAIGSSRLGLRSGVITRVGNDHMGRYIREQLIAEGVDVAGVIVDNDRLTALVILGIRDRDNFPLIFYRNDCADMALNEEDIDAEFIRSSRSILLTGTHLSTDSTFAASRCAIELALVCGTRIILDVDYRPVLWGLTSPELGENRFVADDSVTARLQSVIKHCDLIVGTEEELHILGGTRDTIAALRAIRRLSRAQIVFKRGPLGCTVFDGDIPDCVDDGIGGVGFEIDVFNILGAGDAFLSGFLRGWLRDMPLAECCRLGNACGAIVVSRHGCAPASPSWDELRYFLDEGSPFKALRKDRELEQRHWAAVRSPTPANLCVLAVDHRTFFEELVDEAGNERISRFKALALRAVEKIDDANIDLGLLVDGRHGARVLEQTADLPHWVGRPIELPGSRPLTFDTDLDVVTELGHWPVNQVVKCLCFYHPDDDVVLREQQDAQLQLLASACRHTGHELLLELICASNGRTDPDAVAPVIEHLYSLGVMPDWWKLEAASSLDAWNVIEEAILRNDPLCRGVLVLGMDAPLDELWRKLEIAAGVPGVKGFAVGRTIFAATACDWFAGLLNDEEAVNVIHRIFRTLVDRWHSLRTVRVAADLS